MQVTPRIRVIADRPLRPEKGHVLYWMIGARRTRSNHALDRALHYARTLRKPLWVLEPLRLDHEHASQRLHAFAMRGMVDNAQAFAAGPVGYFPYVESLPGEGKGLVRAFADEACVVITDDSPVYFLRNAVEAASKQIEARLELVDSVGLVPLSAPGKAFARAHDFRRWWQRNTDTWLLKRPNPEPLSELRVPQAEDLPAAVVTGHWSSVDTDALRAGHTLAVVAGLPAHGGVVRGAGGASDGHDKLAEFVSTNLPNYGQRNQPAAKATSGLSPHLHWGHIGAHEVFTAVVESQAQWSPMNISERCVGQREGWWGMHGAAEGFLDQLLTWRELGQGFAWHRADHATYASVPEWARRSLAAHAGDKRPYLYTPTQFESAQTHDEIWNAAQRELVETGQMHNYLRMLWAKKILHWSPTPRQAAEIMTKLNDRYALDGRDPNSYSGIFWTFGRHDRAWGPEREVFGKVRYMTCASTRRKLRLGPYLERFGPQGARRETPRSGARQTELFANPGPAAQPRATTSARRGKR